LASIASNAAAAMAMRIMAIMYGLARVEANRHPSWRALHH
jgi:hypothetical protein